MLPGAETERLASQALLFEEFLAREAAAGRIAGPDRQAPRARCCCTATAIRRRSAPWARSAQTLALVEGLEVETVESSCCGMAGAFGYGADTYEVSLAMGELTLLPAVRRAAPDAIIAADGFSCRHQIHDGTGRTPLHVARILREAMSGSRRPGHAIVTIAAGVATNGGPRAGGRCGGRTVGCQPPRSKTNKHRHSVGWATAPWEGKR